MIYSKRIQSYIPVNVTKEMYSLKDFGNFYKYTVKDGPIPVGYVDLKDTHNGVFVEMIKNNFPELYSGFGKITDQIEVEHCLNRGLKSFQIISEAALNSHALHYLRGKRFNSVCDENKKIFLMNKFKTIDVNKIVANIIKNTPKGEKFVTSMLEAIPMYMPLKLINKYKEIIKKSPLLK